MKKFYTILAAAAVAFGITATAQDLPMQKFAKSAPTELKAMGNSDVQTAAFASIGDLTINKRSMKAPIGGGTPINKIPGDYGEMEYSIASQGEGQGVIGWQGPILNLIELGDAEGTLDIYGFWLGANSQNQFTNKITGTYDASKGTLSVPSGTLVVKDLQFKDGSKSDVYMYQLDLVKGTYSADPIVFTYSAATHGFSFVATDNGQSWTSVLFFTADPDMIGKPANLNDLRGFDFITMIDINMYNGVMEETFNTQNGALDDMNLVYYESFDTSILLYNIQGIGYDKVVEVAVDKAAGKATLNQQVVTLNFGAANGGEKTMIFCSEVGEGDDAKLVPTVSFNGTTTGEEGNYDTVLENNGYYLIDEEGFGYTLTKAKITLFEAALFAPTAIKNVSADFDENAPVEYFNLQGVRVENPANGLYIKRQGNKVAKVIL